MEFEKDYFKMGNRYGRVLFLREYASYIKDSMVAELTDMNRNLMMSMDIVPVPTDEAVKEAENRLLGVETNITNWHILLFLDREKKILGRILHLDDSSITLVFDVHLLCKSRSGS